MSLEQSTCFSASHENDVLRFRGRDAGLEAGCEEPGAVDLAAHQRALAESGWHWRMTR